MSASGATPKKNPDGTTTYVIGGASQEGQSPFIWVKTITERNALLTNRIVFVAEASKGDASVNKGWAAYILVEDTWRKIVEQESVDGPWGINEEIKRALLSREQFNVYANRINATIEQFRQIVEGISGNSHNHSNKSTLDLIGETFGFLKFKSNIVNAEYLYDHIEEGKLMWVDPTITDAEAEEVATSYEIATRFSQTGMALPGVRLSVVEKDGAVSTYTMSVRNGTVVPVFARLVGGPSSTNIVGVTEVTALPLPSAEYANGLYRIVYGPVDVTNAVPGVTGHSYKCVLNSETDAYEWLDVTANPKVNDTIGRTVIRECFKTDWNRTTIVFDAQLNTSSLGDPVMSVIVRTYDTPASSVTDGSVVGTIYAKSGKITDVCPLSRRYVYYTVFQFMGNGQMITSAYKYSKYISWSDVKRILANKTTSDVFAVGDTIILEHTAFGAIAFEVIAIDGETGNVTLSATNKIIDLEFDGVEHGKPKTQDETYTIGRRYFALSNVEVDGAYQERYEELVAGEDFEYGDVIANPNVIFDNANGSSFSPSYDQISYLRHGSADWATSNLKQWLNSDLMSGSGVVSIDDYAWFDEMTSQFDELGASYLKNTRTQDGFLAGFTDTDLRDIIREVRIPASASEVATAERVWSMEVVETPETADGKTYTHRQLKVYSDFAAEIDPVDPEGDNRTWTQKEVDGSMVLEYTTNYIGVAPVIILGAPVAE